MRQTPNPRYRLYTTPRSYTQFWSERLRGMLHEGDDVARFEMALSERYRNKHVVCTPMARVGLYLALKHSIQPGHKVIMSPYTIADVINMVIAAGGIPVFADVERETCNIDPKAVAKLLTHDTAVVLITHLHGLSASADEIRKLCASAGVKLFEDAAQAFGSVSTAGEPLGAIGDVGILSVGTYKNINCWYGGAVVTQDATLASAIRVELAAWPYMPSRFISKRVMKALKADLATWPLIFRTLTFWVFRYGFMHDIKWINHFVQSELDLARHDALPPHYQVRMTPFQARLAHAQLERINPENHVRIRNAQIYHDILQGCSEDLILPPLRTDGSHIYTYYPIQYRDRKALLRWLMGSKWRDVGAQHLKNCADLPSFAEFHRDCPVAREVAANVVLLPTYPRYGHEQVVTTGKAVKDFFRK